MLTLSAVGIPGLQGGCQVATTGQQAAGVYPLVPSESTKSPLQVHPAGGTRRSVATSDIQIKHICRKPSL